MSMTKPRFRRYVTMSVVVTFALVAVTGVIMYFYPKSMPAPGTQVAVGIPSHAGGFSFRYLLKVIHEQVSLLFVIMSAIHVCYNWRALVGSFTRVKAVA